MAQRSSSDTKHETRMKVAAYIRWTRRPMRMNVQRLRLLRTANRGSMGKRSTRAPFGIFCANKCRTDCRSAKKSHCASASVDESRQTLFTTLTNSQESPISLEAFAIVWILRRNSVHSIRKCRTVESVLLLVSTISDISNSTKQVTHDEPKRFETSVRRQQSSCEDGS